MVLSYKETSVVILLRGLRKPNCQSLQILSISTLSASVFTVTAYWGLFTAYTSSSPPEDILWYAWPKMGRQKFIPPEKALSKPWWYLIHSYSHFLTIVLRVAELCAMFYTILIDPQLPTMVSWSIPHPLWWDCLASLPYLISPFL